MSSLYFRKYLSIILVGLLGIMLPLILMRESFEIILIFPFIISLYSVIRLSIIIYNERFSLVEISFFVFVYVFFGLSPLSQIQLNHFPHPIVHNETDLLNAFLIICIGLIGYEIGLLLHKSRNFNSSYNFSNVPNDYKLKSLGLFIVISIGLFMFSSVLIGVGNLFLPRNVSVEAEDVNSSMRQLLVKLQQVPLYIALLFSVVLWKYKTTKGLKTNRDLLLLVIITGLLVINLIINNPISSARYWFGAVYLSLILVLMKWKKLSQTKIVFLLIFIFIIIFPYADLFRNSLETTIEIRDLLSVLASGDFDAFQQVINSSIYTDFYGYSLGYQLLGVLFFWVPRSIWIDKPVGTGYTMGEAFGYEHLNISASLWVEFYVNFGYIGLLLLFIIYGFMTSYMQTKYFEGDKKNEFSFITIFTPFFAVYQFFLLRGDLLSSFAYLAPVILLIIIGLAFKSIPKKSL